MKLQRLFLASIIIQVILLGIYIVTSIEANKYKELQQKEIEGLKKANQEQRDSLQKQLELTKDSLNTAYQNIAIAHKESIEARARSQKTIENLKKILFVVHTDSSRNATLKELYPTFKP